MTIYGKGKWLLQFKIIFPLALCKGSCSTWPGNETKVSERAGSENICEHNKELKEKRIIWKPIGAKKGGKKRTL